MFAVWAAWDDLYEAGVVLVSVLGVSCVVELHWSINVHLAEMRKDRDSHAGSGSSADQPDARRGQKSTPAESVRDERSPNPPQPSETQSRG